MLQPNKRVVLVKPGEPEMVSEGGIVLLPVEDNSLPTRTGEVIAVGEGCSVAVGDRVMFSWDVGQETKDGETLLLAVLDDDLLGVVE